MGDMMTELHAWVDESGSHRQLDPHTYLMAATLSPVQAMDRVREVMRSLPIPGTGKLHWRDETKPARRLKIVQAVASCQELHHLVVLRSGTDTDSRTRPRTATLKQLLYELDRRTVTRAVFESRGTSDDRQDIKELRSLRDGKQPLISPALKVDHAPGPADAGLWVADTICGVITASRTRAEGHQHYLALLQERITIIYIDHNGNTIMP
jgi:hypothetical protein